MLERWKAYLREWKIYLAVRCFVQASSSWSTCGNRVTWTCESSPFTYTLTRRDTRQIDVYSREEIYRLLKLVRETEQRLGWQCPEPQLPQLAVSA